MTSTVKVNNVQASDGGNIINQCGTTITLGASGDTVALASGASQTGFGRAGSVDWQTGSIKTATFTAVSGKGYFCNTTGGVFNCTLPSSPSAGDIVAVSDYGKTFQTNNLTVDRNGSNIQGAASNLVLSAEGVAMTFVYVDGTKGWVVTGAGREADKTAAAFVVACGGTESTCGDYKIHKFTGPGTFTVTAAGNACGSNKVDYLVVAGAGAGGFDRGGGGGAGGYRESSGGCAGGYTIGFPRNSGVTALPVSIQGYPIVVGAGGTGVSTPGQPNTGGKGSDSSFSSITSTGGGQGQNANVTSPVKGGPGGSGGGGSGSGCAGSNEGSGNTPSQSPVQGFDGGVGYDGPSPSSGGGGGGAAAVGGGAGPSGPVPGGGNGGKGGTSAIGGSSVNYAGGGGGGHPNAHSGAGGFGGINPGGSGPAPQADRFGAGDGNQTGAGNAGTVNTGGGGGGSQVNGGNGGSGIVFIRYKYQ